MLHNAPGGKRVVSGEVMPQRQFSQNSFFHPEFVQPEVLKEGTLPWFLAHNRSMWCPSWLFEDWRGQTGKGRSAWPAFVLATLVVLRWSEEGMSRRASRRRAQTDLAWRAAMGLPCDISAPSERTLRDFEAFLQTRHPEVGERRYRILFEHCVAVCLQQKVIGEQPQWAMDSTPMHCYGATLDTIRLLGDGLRGLAIQWGRATRTSLCEVAKDWDLPFLLEKSTKGALRFDWKDPASRQHALTKVIEYVHRGIDQVLREINSARRTYHKTLRRRCRHLLQVLENDVTTDEEGQLMIARGVARDRLVSMTDPCARHGRKSKSRTFNGYKVHVLGDLESGLLTAVSVTPGNRHDGAVAHRLMRRTKDLVQECSRVLADAAYGGARLRALAQRGLGIDIIAPPPAAALRKRKNRIGKLDILVDFEEGSATCPQGIMTKDGVMIWSNEHEVYVPQFHWPEVTCQDCPLRTQCCGKNDRAKKMTLHPYEWQLRQSIEDWKTPEIQKEYRNRARCERLIHEMTRHGGRKARQWGLEAAQLQAHCIAMTCNLKLLARAVAHSSAEQYQAAA